MRRTQWVATQLLGCTQQWRDPPPPLPAVPESLGSIRGRAEIRSAVANGDTAHAIELTRELFPELLEANVELRFALVCMYA